jgi:hypothetical protein
MRSCTLWDLHLIIPPRAIVVAKHRCPVAMPAAACCFTALFATVMMLGQHVRLTVCMLRLLDLALRRIWREFCTKHRSCHLQAMSTGRDCPNGVSDVVRRALSRLHLLWFRDDERRSFGVGSLPACRTVKHMHSIVGSPVVFVVSRRRCIDRRRDGLLRFTARTVQPATPQA